MSQWRIQNGFEDEQRRHFRSRITFWAESCRLLLSATIVYHMLEGSPYKTGRPVNSHAYTISGYVSHSKRLHFIEAHWFAYRFMLVKPWELDGNINSTCVLRTEMKAEPLEHVSQGWSSRRQLSQLPQWYVLWHRRALSWSQANAICARIEGHMPPLKYPHDIVHLKEIVWGLFNPVQLAMNPCRTRSLVCLIFLGNDMQHVSHKVSIS